MKIDRRRFILGATGLFSFLLTSNQVTNNKTATDSSEHTARLEPEDKIVVKNGWIVRSSQLLQNKNNNS